MANNYDAYRVNWASMEIPRLVKNKLAGGIATQFNSAYNDDFKQGFPIGRTMRVPLRYRPTLRVGNQIKPNNYVIPETDITVQQQEGVDFINSDMELIFDTNRPEAAVRAEQLDGAATVIAQRIESTLSAFAALNIPNAVGALQTSPASASIARQARTTMKDLAGWDPNLKFNITPYAMETIGEGEKGTFNPNQLISRSNEEGELTRWGGFNFYESESLSDFTVGTFSGTFAVSGAGQTGSTINITGTNNGDVIKAGTIIVFDTSKRVNPSSKNVIAGSRAGFVVTADTTIASGIAALPIYPPIINPGTEVAGGMANINTPLLNADNITIMPNTTSPSAKAGKVGMVIAKDAFALVSGKFPMPFTGEAQNMLVREIPGTGIKIRQWLFSDGQTGDHYCRYDFVIGYGRLQPDVAAVRLHLGS